ncbi:hypothetical protein BAE44_0012767, partial [Dichanthelium oligosanthes]
LVIVAALVVVALASFLKLFIASSITVSRTLSIIGDRNGRMDSICLCIKSSFSIMWSSIKCNVTS